MKRPTAFFLLAACAAFAAADSPDFPQTGAGQKSDFSSSDFKQIGPAQTYDNKPYRNIANQFSGPPGNAQGENGQSQNGQNGQNGGSPNEGGREGMKRNANVPRKDDRGGDGSNGSAEGPEGPANDSDGSVDGAGMSLADARMNFKTVVEAYLERKSVGGYWTYREKKGGKARKFKLVAIDAESVRTKDSRVYSGLATMREPSGRRVSLEFKVNFSGADWKVISAKLRVEKAKTRR